jgi:hypothetical protein
LLIVELILQKTKFIHILLLHRQYKLVTETHIDLSLEFVTLVLPMGRTGQFHEPQGSWRDPSLVELEIEEDLILGHNQVCQLLY